MEKTIRKHFYSCFFHIFILSLVCCPFTLLADHKCNCEFCGLELDFDEKIHYKELGEYEDMYRTFEEIMEMEENGLCVELGVFKKWGKKVKRWLKKRIVTLIKKCVDLEKIRNAEDCAYTVAKFKKKVDKVHKTGSLEGVLNKFDEHVPSDPRYASLEKFKKRIRFYYDNGSARPPKHPDHDRYNFCANCFAYHAKGNQKSDLDDIPTRALLGGVLMCLKKRMAQVGFHKTKYFAHSLIDNLFVLRSLELIHLSARMFGKK